MAEWTGTVVIPRPVAAVFAFFVHPAHGWRQGNGAPRPAVTQGPARPLAVGTRFLGTEGTDAGAGEAVLEVVAYVPAQVFAGQIGATPGRGTRWR